MEKVLNWFFDQPARLRDDILGDMSILEDGEE